MLKRTVCIENPHYLKFKLNQLVLENRDTGSTRSVPLEDLGFLMIDHPQVVVSQVLMRELARAGVAVVFCDEKHHPSAILQSFEGNSIQTERYRQQIAASEPLRKNLWKQTVEAKISNQAALLDAQGKKSGYLLAFRKAVKSGDTGNQEARAAQVYWKELFGPGFRRSREGLPPNNLLNYGYAVLRASTARAIVSSGLLPSFGIHHRSKYNAFCLADDLMEPYRPFVDAAVYQWMHSRSDFHVMDSETKSHLLNVLNHDVQFTRVKRPLGIGLSLTTASLAGCFAGKCKKIRYPSFC
ncbi:MAG: type II CRISPR-associated endonuclease Cas1 [Bacteroidales bacterium]